DPEQVRAWLASAAEAYAMLGEVERRAEAGPEAVATLDALRRGVFARHDLEAGDPVGSDRVWLAIPSQPGQLLANDLSKYRLYRTRRRIAAGEPVLRQDLVVEDVRERVLEAVRRVVALVRDSGTAIPDGAPMALSHHYGIDRFGEWGAALFDVVNRAYCKKVIVLLPGQGHPRHRHRRKEETFHVLHGTLEVELDGSRRQVGPGEMVTVEPGVAHTFRSDAGAVFEEISTTHYPDDSEYDDPAIGRNTARKTHLRFRRRWLAEEPT
ncbi:MAG: cupin domain-containing protein, partial [Nitrospirae bacterium]